jgi:nitrite reductase (NO-forming)
MKSRFFSIMLLLVLAVMAAACSTPPGPNSASNATNPTLAAAQADMPGMSSTPAAVQPHKTYDPVLPPATADTVKQITLHVTNVTTEIAPGVPMDEWTFNGTVPGPVLHVNLGDTVKFTLVNDGTTDHSIDLHAAQTPWNINYVSIAPGKSLSFDFKANYPGVFMYHCGTPPVIHHLAMGMYGAIVVSSPDLKPVAKEYVLVQSEFYVTKGANGIFQTDGAKLNAVTPDYVVFNGYADQYKDAPLTANPGERIRLWVVNAGPTTFSAFHVIGAIFDAAYESGNPQNVQHGMQTVTIPPGGGYMVELVIPDAGLYPFVTHSFAYTGKGALGLIKVGNGGK